MKFVLGRVENIVAKGENAGYPFPTTFSKAFTLRVVKSQDCVVKIYSKDIHIIFWSVLTELLPLDEICAGDSRSILPNN